MGLTTTAVSEDDYYYTEDFKTLMRSHRDFILEQTPPSKEVDTNLLQAYHHDFYRLLKHHKVPPKFWWLCAYLSDIKTPFDDIRRLDKWYNPSPDVIEQIIARNNTTIS